ncbi:MAG: hypothetical protein GOMPHAMPRED_005101 [Gomphillus americanus]|uniref:Uncharacterized protein n=1 Tax=Gomphillus americanus TaxID=1940652 RepID=A0A8H3ER59_9LECA|nr:MAG: hypothetical protein GOMPHAMPRED_005101 [Gomphillus americanus]
MQLTILTLFAASAATTMAFQYNSYDNNYLSRRDIDDSSDMDTFYARDLVESYLDDLYIRDLEDAYLEARTEKEHKQRLKDEKKWKEKSDKLRNEYLKKAAKEGRRTLSASEIAEIQRLLSGEDNGGWPRAT